MATPVLPRDVDAVVGTVESLGVLAADGILPRETIVWLPPSYTDEPDRRYPVLFMHDGHNAIDPATSYSGEDWQIDDVATQLIEAGRVREFLLVAPYATDDRFEEYGAGAPGRAYLAFLTDVLKPLIDQRYRTLAGRDDTFVMGSSMGGLISFLAVWHRPDVWSGAACLSPYFPPEVVEALEADSTWPPAPLRLYLDNGGDELDESFQPAIDRVLASLAGRSHLTGPEWFRDAGAPHHEPAWSHRVWRPLECLLGA